MSHSISTKFFSIIRLVVYIFLLPILSVFISGSERISAASPHIEILQVDGTIVPAVANYLERGIRDAESNGSTVCIIELDTPGGLLNTTEDIVKTILNARVPVVVYVTPRGAWAASAGTFITVSAHIAAMAPGTTIGAAHPVSVEGQLPDEVSKKATEYSAAYIRSIAEQRGRNPDQAELAVKESKSFTSTQALENRLIDLQADDLDSLIKQLNGRKVKLADGREAAIMTDGYAIERNEMTWIESFLHSISDPNIAYILLSVATIGLITEISNPGLIFPGVVGGISLFLALYSLGSLNAYWAGLLLIILAFGLFIAELFTSAFGILTAGGLIALLIGSFMLFSQNVPVLQVNPALIIIVVIAIAAIVIFLLGAVVRGQRRQVVTGSEGLVGKIAVAQTKLDPRGKVLMEGEHWTATIENGTVEPGEEVLVSKVDGLKLIVRKKES